MDLERVQVRVHRLRRLHTGDAEKFRLGKESLADWGSHACGRSEHIDLIQKILILMIFILCRISTISRRRMKTRMDWTTLEHTQTKNE